MRLTIAVVAWLPSLQVEAQLSGKRVESTILVAIKRQIGGLGSMGAKYYPTIKDQKASQRFQQKQNLLQKQKKASEPLAQPVKEEKKR
jgi:hypothetical protein